MQGLKKVLGLVLLVSSSGMFAQTTVTNNNDGATGSVPVYTGSATLGNSPIAVSGSNVGIGTTTPNYFFELDKACSGCAAHTMTLVNPAPEVSGSGNDIDFYDYTFNAYPGARIQSVDDGNYGSHLYFGTKPAGNNLNNVTTRLTILDNGNVGIGTTNPAQLLEVNGTVQVDGALNVGNGGIVFPNGGGTQTVAYTGVSCGGDYAESMDATGDRTRYGPGDLLVLDTGHPGKVLKSVEAYSTTVAGIYSTKPGTVGRRQTGPKSPDEVPMAMVGVVPTKATAENGGIKVGDLLVSSSKPGYAMKGTDRSRMLGAVIGKAMGNLDAGTGVIEVLVTLQ